ncbi:MAG: Rrf2 family transcriptional regulator [Candidatus Omnitrophica bacterium]|nr:Rrf2 family transcriptional regulator [Candidatus Omnitrophota bacterium]
MKLITRETDYAVRALMCLANNQGMVMPVEKIVREIKLPHAFARRLIQVLAREGIVRSVKGKNGGCELAKNLDKIKLVDIMAIFQGDVCLNECLFKKNICPNRSTCPLRKKIRAIESLVLKELRSITLATLMH